MKPPKLQYNDDLDREVAKAQLKSICDWVNGEMKRAYLKRLKKRYKQWLKDKHAKTR